MEVQVITATVQQSDTLAELECHSSCSPAGVSYVWFKNNEKIMTTFPFTLQQPFHREILTIAKKTLFMYHTL
ncbi:hypothetical protein F7725_006135 [Dissostichus mawsoni]|uniref:Ig-like domain-containing protein n=1 Tax=Dissostichus mawsoni TaxID=36200 RepID=A0A7J5YTK3_DISMA|nr:hypothetical protein F7725_006135 [Dissostichus mawsoni]